MMQEIKRIFRNIMSLRFGSETREISGKRAWNQPIGENKNKTRQINLTKKKKKNHSFKLISPCKYILCIIYILLISAFSSDINLLIKELN